MSTYCIIGGTGFLGTALRRRLGAAGHKILVVGRAENAKVTAREQYVSSRDFARFMCESTHERFAAVIDMAYATVPSTSVEDPVADFSTNLRAVLHHLDVTSRVEADRYVFVSSGGTVYGDMGEGPLPENTNNQPISPYGITKLACERYTQLMHRTKGLSTLIVRPSNVYGPGQLPFRGQGFVSTALGAALSGAPLEVYGDGSHVRDFLYVDDFCSGLMAVLTKGSPGENYNLGSGNGLTIRTVLGHIAQLLKFDGLELKIEWRQPRPFDVHHNVLDIAKLRAVSGWRPQTPFKSGLAATYAWIKSRYN